MYTSIHWRVEVKGNITFQVKTNPVYGSTKLYLGIKGAYRKNLSFEQYYRFLIIYWIILLQMVNTEENGLFYGMEVVQ